MSVPSSGRGRGGRGTRRPSGAQDRTSSSSRGVDRTSDASQGTSRRQTNDGDTLASPIAAQGVSQTNLPASSPDHPPLRPSRSQQQARNRRHWDQIDHWRQDQPALAGVRGPTTATQSGRRQAEIHEGQESPFPQTPLASQQQRKQRTGTLMAGSPQPTAADPSNEATMASSLEGGGAMGAQDPLSLRTANLQLQAAPPLSQGFYRPPVPGSTQAPPRGYGVNQPYGNHPTPHAPPQPYPYYQQQQVMYPAPVPHHQGSILQVPPPPPQYYHPDQPLSYPQPMPAPAQQQESRRYRQRHHGGQAASMRASPHSAGTTSAAPPPSHYEPPQGRPQQPPGPYRGGGGGGGQPSRVGRGITNGSLVSPSTSGENRVSSSGPDPSTRATTASEPKKPNQGQTSTSTPAGETGLTELDRGEQSLPEASGPAAMRSEHVMWVGNIPSNATQEELFAFFSTLPPDPNAPLPEPAHGIVSIFFIPRSKCAFINLTSEQRLKTAVEIFNGRQLRPQEARSLRLVCRIRKKDEEAQAGVGHQRGRGMHVAWYKEQKQKPKQTANVDGAAAAAESTAEADKTGAASVATDGDGQQSDGNQEQQSNRSRSADGVKGEEDDSDSSLPLPRSLSSTDSSTEGPQQRKHGLSSHTKKEDGNHGGGSNDSPSDHSGGSTSFGSSNSELLSQPAFAIRYFILKSHDVKELDLAVQKGEWATQRHNIAVLNQAFRNSKTVYLIFSANQSGAFFGYAKMKAQKNSPLEAKPDKEQDEKKTDVPPATSTADEHHQSGVENRLATGGNEPHEAAAMEHEEGRKQQEAVASRNGSSGTDDEMPEKEAVEASSAMMAKQSATSPPSATTLPIAAAAAAASSSRPFSIEWIQTRPLPFYVVKGMRNPWNDGKSVRVARDGTEISPDVGAELLKSWERHVENQSQQQQQQQQGQQRDDQ